MAIAFHVLLPATHKHRLASQPLPSRHTALLLSLLLAALLLAVTCHSYLLLSSGKPVCHAASIALLAHLQVPRISCAASRLSYTFCLFLAARLRATLPGCVQKSSPGVQKLTLRPKAHPGLSCVQKRILLPSFILRPGAWLVVVACHSIVPPLPPAPVLSVVLCCWSRWARPPCSLTLNTQHSTLRT